MPGWTCCPLSGMVAVSQASPRFPAIKGRLQMNPPTLSVLSLRSGALALLVLMGLSLASNLKPASAADLSGRWKGRWTSAPSAGHSRQHSGSLRVRLKNQGGGHYQGIFAGRFAVVIPYIYRADVYQVGNSLISTKRLGPLGEYQMHLVSPKPGSLQGGWSAMGEAGSIKLQRH